MPATVEKDKKARERRFLNAFIRITKMPISILSEREAPDFLLDVGGRSVGLEVTELFVGAKGGQSEPKASESIVDRIVADARRRYEKRGGRPLHVSFGFSPNADFRLLSRDNTAEALATFLAALDLPVGELLKWKRPILGANPLPHQLEFMHVLALPHASMSPWVSPRAGWISPLTSDVLQPFIDRKAAKIHEYRQSMTDVWLLLAIEGNAPSQFFEPAEETPAVLSPVERTYLLSLFAGTVELLRSVHDA
jgi:hypothetical protein